MEVHPIRTERGARTWEVWDGPYRYAVCEFPDGRVVCIPHDHECRHALAARFEGVEGYSGGSFSLTSTDIC